MTDTITIAGLGRLDYLDLDKQLRAEGLTADEQVVNSPGQHGELATVTALVILAAPMVGALAGWLLKGRDSNTIKFRGRRRQADGTEEDYEFEHRITSEQEAKPELMTALATFFKIDLTQALGGDQIEPK